MGGGGWFYCWVISMTRICKLGRSYLYFPHVGTISVVCNFHFVAMDAFLTKYREKVRSGSAPGLNGQCRIWTGARSSNNKYGVVCFKHPVKNKWVTVHVHRLSVMLHHGYHELDASIVASHLCHNTLCVVPEHITLEPHGINNQRQTCRARGTCLGHFPYLPCRLDLIMNDMN